jgi:hypothetical protein
MVGLPGFGLGPSMGQYSAGNAREQIVWNHPLILISNVRFIWKSLALQTTPKSELSIGTSPPRPPSARCRLIRAKPVSLMKLAC